MNGNSAHETSASASDSSPETDGELVLAAAAGQRGALAEIYDRYASRLFDFSVGILRDRDTAADCVHEVFCIAATRLSQLRQPERLRPWLYAITRSEALRHLRARRREELPGEMIDTASDDPDPAAQFLRTELAELVEQAAGGLTDRDRLLLEHSYRHGLDAQEIAEILQVSPAHAHTLLHRLRRSVERSLAALLLARQAPITRQCREIQQILSDWDGQMTVMMRKRIVRHIESCAVCDQEREQLANPVALLGGAAVFIPAPDWLRQATLHDIELTSANRPVGVSHGPAVNSTKHAGRAADDHTSDIASAHTHVAPKAEPATPERTGYSRWAVTASRSTFVAGIALTVWALALDSPHNHHSGDDISNTAPATPARSASVASGPAPSSATQTPPIPDMTAPPTDTVKPAVQHHTPVLGDSSTGHSQPSPIPGKRERATARPTARPTAGTRPPAIHATIEKPATPAPAPRKNRKSKDRELPQNWPDWP